MADNVLGAGVGFCPGCVEGSAGPPGGKSSLESWNSSSLYPDDSSTFTLWLVWGWVTLGSIITPQCSGFTWKHDFRTWPSIGSRVDGRPPTVQLWGPLSLGTSQSCPGVTASTKLCNKCCITVVYASKFLATRSQWTWVPNSLLMGVNSVDYEPQGTEVIQSTYYLATVDYCW